MTKRTLLIGGYDTAAHGWTLTPGWRLSAPEQKTNYIEKVAGDGSWDLSTTASDGIPRYRNRVLEDVVLECSEGTRADREALISEMVNRLDGMHVQLILPDKTGYYLMGRVHVARGYNDLAHAAVTVSATCEPWYYAKQETVVTLTASADRKTVKLVNNGRRAAVPKLMVEGDGASVLVEYNGASTSVSEGIYEWPTLLLTTGEHTLAYSGNGTLTVAYREAVLE